MADLLPPASPDELPLITRLRAANPHCMTSLCHGDLTAANIAITHTGWTLLDWEWLAPAHPWADMLRLAFKHGHRHPWLLCSISRHAEYLDPAGRNGYIHGIALLVAPIWQKRPALRPHCRSFVEAALSATR